MSLYEKDIKYYSALNHQLLESNKKKELIEKYKGINPRININPLIKEEKESKEKNE